MIPAEGFRPSNERSFHSIRLRFLGIPVGEPVDAMRVIYEHHWCGLGEIGERRLRPVTRD